MNVRLASSPLSSDISSVVSEFSIVICTVSPGPSRSFEVLLTFSILFTVKFSEVRWSIPFFVVTCMTVSSRLIPSDPG